MGTLRWFQLERAVGVWWSSSRKTPQELLWIGLSWHIACTSYATHTQAFNCHFPYFALVSQIYAPKRGITEAAHWFHKPDALPAAPSTVTKYWRIHIGSAVFSFTHMVSAPHVKPTALKKVARFYCKMPFLAPTPFSRLVQHAEDRIWYAYSNAQHTGICASCADISKTKKVKLWLLLNTIMKSGSQNPLRPSYFRTLTATEFSCQ